MEWKTVKLGDYIEDIAAGPFGSNLKVECFVPIGFPIIDGANLRGYTVTDNVTKFVTEEKARSLHRSIATRGEVIVTISGNVGQIAYIPDNSKYEEYLVSQRQFRVRFKDTADVPYLVYYFHSREGQHQILSFANQTGVPALAQPLKNFRNIKLPLPPLAEQKRIAAILSSLDAKIENNNRINANLEAQAQALYKSWFVDFESWGGKMPEDWKEGKLSELLDIKYGKDHKKLQDGNIPVYGSGGLMRMAGQALYIGESVLIPRKGTLNNVMYVNEAFWTVDTMFYSVPKQDNVAIYSYLYLCNRDLSSMNAGSAVPSMTTDILNKMDIVIPTKDALDRFNTLAYTLFCEYKHNLQDSQRLAQMRDTLLPKLMKGEIAL